MCVTPCETCSTANFYSCLTCADSTHTLTGSLCITSTTMVYQIITTSFMILFILPVLLRKRCVVLVKILDFIQICSYFKFIVAYNPNRHVFLYLNMRGWGTWEEGWQIVEGDLTPSIWTNEEGAYDKLIRISATWGLFLFLMMVIGLLKVLLS